MIEREVTDIVQVTFSIGLASIYVFSDIEAFDKYPTTILSLLILSIIAFIHNILTQLKMIKPSISKYFSTGSQLILLASFISHFGHKPRDWGSFWGKFGFTVEITLIVGYVILSAFVGLSSIAVLAYNEPNSE